jgi:polyribonucleotide nucleotidyltransferase
VKVIICELPPAPGELAVDIKCFNMKINSTSVDIEVIKTDKEFDKLACDQILQGNTYLPIVKDIMVAELTKQLKMAAAKTKVPYLPLDNNKPKENAQSAMKVETEDSSEDEGITYMYKIDSSLTGFIIGYYGKTIKRMQKETGTRMRVTDWEDGKAVQIQGPDSESINKAKRKLDTIIRSNKRKISAGSQDQSMKKQK